MLSRTTTAPSTAISEIIANDKQLRIEYHPASDGTAAKTPDDFVTVDLEHRKLVHFTG